MNQNWTSPKMEEPEMDKPKMEQQIPLQAVDPIDEFLNATKNNLIEGDIFDQFVNGFPLISTDADSVIRYICQDGNLPRSIRQHSLDVLSIPAMSAELERVFSSARLLITHLRSNLSAESIEVLELLRYWWVRNLVQQETGGGGRTQRKRKAVELQQMEMEQ